MYEKRIKELNDELRQLEKINAPETYTKKLR